MRALAALLSVTLASFPSLAKEEKAPRRNGTWVREQLARWELTREGAAPFRLQAKLEVRAKDGSWVPGTYTLAWASPTRWREEVRFAGYEEIEACYEDVSWWQRPRRYRPRIPAMLTSPTRLISPTDVAEFRQPRPKGAPAVACIEEDCVDARTGELRSMPARPSGTARTSPLLLEFEAATAFGVRTWPAGYHLRDGDHEIARSTIESIEPLDTLPEEALAPPSTATRVPTCAKPTLPRIIPSTKGKAPYPDSLRKRGIQGVAQLHGTVGVDGSVQDLEVSYATHPELGEIGVDTVKQWRYEPARCGEVPVPVEVWVQVDWTIGTGIP